MKRIIGAATIALISFVALPTLHAQEEPTEQADASAETEKTEKTATAGTEPTSERPEEPTEGAESAEDASEPQTTELEPPQPDTATKVVEETTVSTRVLVEENEKRSATNRTAMLVLGGWSLANIGWATAGLLTNQENPARSFHLTNAAWNLVNGTISVIGYFSNANRDWNDHDLVRTLEKDHTAEKTLLFNAGLDVGYIFAGAWLVAKGNDERKDGLIGMGRSVMLQGAFLLAFDATVFTIHWLRRQAFQKRVRGTE